MSEDDNQWHWDKKVPIALIVTILLQTGSALWWASGVNTRVDQLERQMIVAAPQAERIIRLETKMDSIFAAIAEIKSIVQQPSRR